MFAGAQAAHEAVVDAAEQLLFLVRDTDDRELREAVEVVDDAGVLQLVDLVENDDGSRAVMLLESIDEFVVRRRLSVDIDGGAEVVEDLVERPESGVVAPAVDVGGLDVEDLFPESFGDELRVQVLPVPLGPVTIAVSAGSPFVMGSRTLERWLTSASRCSLLEERTRYGEREHRGSYVSDRMIPHQIIKA